MLSRPGVAEAAPIAWFDLGQAHEALDDIPHAAEAFAAFAESHPADADGWRRLLYCRLRLDDITGADTCLAKHRSAKGDDAGLVARLTLILSRSRVSALERARLAGWFGARLSLVLARRMSHQAIVEHWDRQRGHEARARVDRALADAREAMHNMPTPEADAAIHAALLCLPLIGAPILTSSRARS